MLYELESKLLEVKDAIEVINRDEYLLTLRKHDYRITLSYDKGKKKVLLEQKEWLENMIAKFPK